MLDLSDPNYVIDYLTREFSEHNRMPEVIPMSEVSLDNLHEICKKEDGIVVTPLNGPAEIYGPDHKFKIGDVFAGAVFVYLH